MSTEQRHSLGMWMPLTCGWLLGLTCFTLPGRGGPEGIESLDILAILKVAIRFGSFFGLSLTLLANWSRPRRKLVVACVWPLALFSTWAVVTAIWSPLKAVSVGQVIGLIDLCLLVACVALLWQSPADTSRIVFHLSAALLLLSAVVVATDLVAHDLSGLNREEWTDHGSSSGLVHPTTAGATSSLGLVLLISGSSLFTWKWARILLIPGTAIQGLMLLLAASRMAMIMAFGALGLLFVLRASAKVKVLTLVAGSLLGVAVLIADPGMKFGSALADTVMEQLSRGESSEQLAGLNGRNELWTAIWSSYLDSPLIGHGYFVSSAEGEIDVWEGPANRTAHNAVLQVLVSTGAVGLLLWLVALVYPFQAVLRSYQCSLAFDRELAQFFIVIAAWYVGWAQLSESFMGPVQPESVVFFTIMGIAIAQVDPALVLEGSHETLDEPACKEASL